LKSGAIQACRDIALPAAPSPRPQPVPPHRRHATCKQSVEIRLAFNNSRSSECFGASTCGLSAAAGSRRQGLKLTRSSVGHGLNGAAQCLRCFRYLCLVVRSAETS
jgi:hypothetical protein